MLKKISFIALLLLGGAASLSAQTMRLATYNIRYDNKQDTANAWLKRVPYLTDL
ncbi:MAG: endonuclease, partial [Hymenobacter sp.]